MRSFDDSFKAKFEISFSKQWNTFCALWTGSDVPSSHTAYSERIDKAAWYFLSTISCIHQCNDNNPLKGAASLVLCMYFLIAVGETVLRIMIRRDSEMISMGLKDYDQFRRNNQFWKVHLVIRAAVFPASAIPESLATEQASMRTAYSKVVKVLLYRILSSQRMTQDSSGRGK